MYKEVYLTYFDLMGFKDFILKNEPDYVASRMNRIYLDLETALAGNNFKRESSGLYRPDVLNASLNCINISDTIIYWTNELDYNSLCNLFTTTYLLNHYLNISDFPVRGCLIKGTIDCISGGYKSDNDTFYAAHCLYGKGVVEAHNKAESQEWAGTVVDQSVVNVLESQQSKKLIERYCVPYRIPYKVTSQCPTGDIGYDEYAFKLLDNIPSDEVLNTTKENIENVFSKDNKSIQGNVQSKLNNTLLFAEFLRNYPYSNNLQYY